MNDIKTRYQEQHQGIAKLINAVGSDHFGKEVLEFVSTAGPIRNFGTYFFPDSHSAQPFLSIWHGGISDYWFRKNAAGILSQTSVKEEMQDRINASPKCGVYIELWRPPKDDFRYEMFHHSGILQRIIVASRSGKTAQQSFFLRSESDREITNQEMEAFRKVLPIAHELINLRHKIVGSEAFQFSSGTSVSSLRERGVQAFASLSPRESEVCDCIVRGMTAGGTAIELGISESTVRTLRQRAYRKLNVTAAGEVMALVINDSRITRR